MKRVPSQDHDVSVSVALPAEFVIGAKEVTMSKRICYSVAFMIGRERYGRLMSWRMHIEQSRDQW